MAEYIEREEYCEKHCRCHNEYCDKASCPIWKAPAADVAPVRHGKWISVNMAYGEYKCSVCEGMDSDCSDYYGSHGVLNQEYCPWCGAKMDGEENGSTD